MGRAMTGNVGLELLLFLFLIAIATGLSVSFCRSADLPVQPRASAHGHLITDPGTGLAIAPKKGNADVKPASAGIPAKLITDPGTNTGNPPR